MLDYMPFKTTDIPSIENAYHKNILKFVESIEKANPKTGEIYYLVKKKYLNLTFIFTLDNQKDLEKLTVRGSIHTFSNYGLHNANILTFKEFTKCLDSYEDLFGLDLTKCELLPIEYGNILYLSEFSDYYVDDIILNIHCVKRKMFNYGRGIDTSIISGKSSSEVRVKCYSKSAEYPDYCYNALKVETKVTKSRGLVKKGIVYVSDLYEIKNHIILLEKHLENLSKIVLYDFTMNIPKNSKYVKEARKLNNQSYWRKLINKCDKGEEYYTKYNDKVELLNFLSKTYGGNILNKLLQQTQKQLLKALGLCFFCSLEVTKKPKNAQYIKPKNARLCIECIGFLNNIIKSKEKTIISIKDNCDKKHCDVTGFNISNQKECSKNLSKQGVKSIYKNNPETFLLLQKTFLTPRYINEDLDVKSEKISHNIRNYKSNTKRKQEKLYPKNQATLIDLPPAIDKLLSFKSILNK